MFIKEGNISLAASYQYVERHKESASLTIWTGDPPPGPSAPPIPAPTRDRLELSSGARVRAAQAEAEERLLELSDEDDLDPKVRLAKLLIEILTGKRIRILRAQDLHPESAEERGSGESPPSRGGAEDPAPRQGWGVVYREESAYAERQELTFSAEGVVRTRDGREIAFTLDLAVSREFASYSRLDLLAGDAVRKDPLVINFDGLTTELTDTLFQFDLDADGSLDGLRFVRPGAGFLAFDRNGDGQVNDGRELFGPQTGDGLRELAAYDSDGNGWIDEGDPVYAQLGVWTKGAGGTDILTPLAAAKVGAVSLSAVGTRFDLKDQANTLQAETSRLGIWLTEDGEARTLQQLDLMV